jgi:hypothetical protein
MYYVAVRALVFCMMKKARNAYKKKKSAKTALVARRLSNLSIFDEHSIVSPPFALTTLS